MLDSEPEVRTTCLRGLLNEVRDLVAERVDLDGEADVHPLAFAHLYQPVEQRLPVLVAREIVVGDEELVDALRPIEPHQMLDVVA